MASRAQGTLLAGRYRVVDRLGSGGMATVFLAEDERLGRRVAVKRLHAETPGDAAVRFEREAKVGASLNHPNLVAVFDTVTDPEGVLIVMEYVEGETLKEVLSRGPVDPARALQMVRGVAAALDHAHGSGVVHRDVKPANILLGPDGTVKLADLGIAKAAERTQITGTGTVLGTPAYMAPEQLEGAALIAAVDVYALAAVTFEAFSGRKARVGRSPMEIAHRVANDPPPDIRDAWPEAPPALAEALKRGMARDPRERPYSAGALHDEIAAALETAPEVDDATEATLPMPARPASRPSPGAPAEGRPPAVRPAAAAARPARSARPPAPDAPSPASARPPAHAARTPRRGRRLAPWLPIAAVLLVLAGGVLALASSDGDGDGDRAADEAQSGGKASGRKRGSGGSSGSATSPAPAPAGEETTGDDGSSEGTNAGGQDPAEGARLNDQGFELFKQGRYAEAVPILERAVAAFPEGSSDINYAYALYNLGSALRRSGRPAEAVPYLEKRLRYSDNQRGVVERELALARQEAEGGSGSSGGGKKGKKKEE